MKEAASIGIIGGADGPTAIMVSGDPTAFIAIAVIAIAVIGIVVWKLMKR
ncbi:MAG: sodium ion-translocating decarboxylase subunit beta [Oscillospiraceae bacterium]|nr:sodium ion-translocating decarboxylase subunit beta [Oscillospiraceae bacterium]